MNSLLNGNLFFHNEKQIMNNNINKNEFRNKTNEMNKTKYQEQRDYLDSAIHSGRSDAISSVRSIESQNISSKSQTRNHSTLKAQESFPNSGRNSQDNHFQSNVNISEQDSYNDPEQMSQESIFHWKLSEISQYLMLHHLRNDISVHVTDLGQSVYDLLAFKNILFSMYQKPISYEMLQDFILLSSRQYRITLDLYRDISNFFRVCFLSEKIDSYDREAFEGDPIYASPLELEQINDNISESNDQQSTNHDSNGHINIVDSKNQFYSQLLKILEKRVYRGESDALSLRQLEREASKHIPERKDENYDFLAFRLLMRQYKDCMNLIVKQDDDLKAATNIINKLEPKLQRSKEKNKQLRKENEILLAKLHEMEQIHDKNLEQISGDILEKSGQIIRKAKRDQKLNNKYVSQLGKKFKETIITISSRMRLFHRSLLDVMDDEKSKLSIESNVKMNTMIVHVTHLIQKFDDISESLNEISTELDRILRSRVQGASTGILTQKAISQEGKKIVKAKKTLLTMKAFLGDLNSISELIVDIQKLKTSNENNDLDTLLERIRKIINDNVEGVSNVNDEIHEILSSINLTAARNIDKEVKTLDKKVNRFNLTEPVAQMRQGGEEIAESQIEGERSLPDNESESESDESPGVFSSDFTDSDPPTSFTSWGTVKLSDGSSLQALQGSSDPKIKMNEKIAFVKEVYEERVKDLQKKLLISQDRIKELERKGSFGKKNKKISKPTLGKDNSEESLDENIEHFKEHHFAEDFDYVDPEHPEDAEVQASRLQNTTGKMIDELTILESENPVSPKFIKELKKKAKEKFKLQKKGKMPKTKTLDILNQISQTLHENVSEIQSKLSNNTLNINSFTSIDSDRLSPQVIQAEDPVLETNSQYFKNYKDFAFNTSEVNDNPSSRSIKKKENFLAPFNSTQMSRMTNEDIDNFDDFNSETDENIDRFNQQDSAFDDTEEELLKSARSTDSQRGRNIILSPDIHVYTSKKEKSSESKKISSKSYKSPTEHYQHPQPPPPGQESAFFHVVDKNYIPSEKARERTNKSRISSVMSRSDGTSNSTTSNVNNAFAGSDSSNIKLPSIITPYQGPPASFRGSKSKREQNPKWLRERVNILHQDSLKTGQKRYVSNLDVFAMFNDIPENENSPPK